MIDNFGKRMPVPYIDRVEIQSATEKDLEDYLGATSTEGDYADPFTGAPVTSACKITVRASLLFTTNDTFLLDDFKQEIMDDYSINFFLVTDPNHIELLKQGKRNFKKIIEAYNEPSSAESGVYYSRNVLSMRMKDFEDSFVVTETRDENYNRVIQTSDIAGTFVTTKVETFQEMYIFAAMSTRPIGGLRENFTDIVFALNFSDLAYEPVVRNNSVAVKSGEGYFKPDGSYYTDVPIMGLNNRYHAVDNYNFDDLVTDIKTTIDRYQQYRNRNKKIDSALSSIDFILSKYYEDPLILVQLNKYASVFPNTAKSARVNRLYKNFKIAVNNANTKLMEQPMVEKRLLRNAKIEDYRLFSYVFDGDASVYNDELEAKDFLYRAVLQTNIAKYQQVTEGDESAEVPYDAESFEWDIRNAVDNLIFSVMPSWEEAEGDFGLAGMVERKLELGYETNPARGDYAEGETYQRWDGAEINRYRSDGEIFNDISDGVKTFLQDIEDKLKADTDSYADHNSRTCVTQTGDVLDWTIRRVFGLKTKLDGDYKYGSNDAPTVRSTFELGIENWAGTFEAENAQYRYFRKLEGVSDIFRAYQILTNVGDDNYNIYELWSDTDAEGTFYDEEPENDAAATLWPPWVIANRMARNVCRFLSGDWDDSSVYDRAGHPGDSTWSGASTAISDQVGRIIEQYLADFVGVAGMRFADTDESSGGGGYLKTFITNESTWSSVSSTYDLINDDGSLNEDNVRDWLNEKLDSRLTLMKSILDAVLTTLYGQDFLVFRFRWTPTDDYYADGTGSDIYSTINGQLPTDPAGGWYYALNQKPASGRLGASSPDPDDASRQLLGTGVEWGEMTGPDGAVMHGIPEFRYNVKAKINDVIEEIWDNYRDKIMEIYLTALPWINTYHGVTLGAGRHNKLAYTNIHVQKYGWYFFDLEKYIRFRSQISQYLDPAKIEQLFPNGRSALNDAVRIKSTKIRNSGFPSEGIGTLGKRMDLIQQYNYDQSSTTAYPRATNTEYSGESGSPASVRTLAVSSWRDFSANPDTGKLEVDGERAPKERIFAQLSWRNVDFPNTDLPDEYRLAAFNFNFFVDDDQELYYSDSYMMEVEVYDNTLEVLQHLRTILEEQYQILLAYYELATENCAFNQFDSVFTDFFEIKMMQKYESNPSEAPWVTTAVTYSTYLDLFTNIYQGDMFTILDKSRVLMDSINPKTGWLSGLESFVASFEALMKEYDSLLEPSYGPTSFPVTETFLVQNIERDDPIADYAVDADDFVPDFPDTSYV
tara:strand:+ start:3059 stop:6877 length:3819 start_codon:yes stop_codon:yes gene_type:complete